MSTTKEFKMLNKLGEGSFSIVYKVKRLSDGQEYAMKKVKMNMLKPKERENALNEVRLLASISTDNIVAYKEAFIEDSCLYVIMEFCDQGDIQGKINSHSKKRSMFTEAEIWKALVDITKGLKDLHDKKVLHRDLKCANVFISKDGTYKLGDMNVSKVNKRGLVYTQTGTPYYASPEIWSDKPYDAKCDIWSLGCVVYEMAALKPPFRAMDMEGLYRKIQKGQFDRIPRQYSNELQTIISAFLKVNPRQRPDAEQILNNPMVMRMIGGQGLKNFDSNGSNSQDAQLLNTIVLPRNLQLLNGKLPKSNYESKRALEAPEPLKDIQEEENDYNVNIEKTRKNRVVSAGPRRILEKNLGNVKSPKVDDNRLPLISKQDQNVNYNGVKQTQNQPKIIRPLSGRQQSNPSSNIGSTNQTPQSAKPQSQKQLMQQQQEQQYQQYQKKQQLLQLQKEKLLQQQQERQKQLQQQNAQQRQQQYSNQRQPYVGNQNPKQYNYYNQQQNHNGPVISRPQSGISNCRSPYYGNNNNQNNNKQPQKYDYLYQKYEANDIIKKNRPQSAIADLQQGSRNTQNQQQQVRPKQYSRQPSGGVVKSYDYNQELQSRLMQKEQHLLGRYQNSRDYGNIPKPQGYTPQSQNKGINQGLQRHQSAKNNIQDNRQDALYRKYNNVLPSQYKVNGRQLDYGISNNNIQGQQKKQYDPSMYHGAGKQYGNVYGQNQMKHHRLY